MIIEVTLACLVLQLILGLILWLYIKELYDRPGSLGSPIFGNLYYFYRTLLFLSLDSGEKYYSKLIDKTGKGICFHWLHGRRSLILSCPILAKKIAFNPSIAEKPAILFSAIRVFTDGVFASPLAGKEWKARKKVMNISFKRSRTEELYHNVFVRIGKSFVEDLIANRRKLEIEVICSRAASNSILGTHAGIPEKLLLSTETYKIIHKFMDIAARSLINPIEGNIIFRLAKFFKSLFMNKTLLLEKLAQENIYSKVKNFELKSSEEQLELPLVLLIVLKNKQRNIPWEQTKKELFEVILTGSHTVSTALAGAINFLAVLPEIQEKAWQEQFTIFGNDTRDPTSEDIKRMDYLNRFIKEVLRFVSPPMIPKWTIGKVDVDGIVIPAGTTVLFLTRKMHMDPQYWNNPEEFDPDRFLQEDNLPKYSFLPFGIGVRSCPGGYYATYEIKVLLSALLRRVKLSSFVRFQDLKYFCNMLVDIKNHPELEIDER